MKLNQILISFILLNVLLNSVNAIFYLPGMFPQDFAVGDEVSIKVNKITSVHTQIPYKYYQIPGVCQPKEIKDDEENLGEILLGDRIENSLYKFEFNTTNEESKCRVLRSEGKCDPHVGEKDLKVLQDRIKNSYRVHWLLDGLPVRLATRQASDPGFDLGYTDQAGKKNLNNHVIITIEYHKNPTDNTYRIVGFLAETKSIQYSEERWNKIKDREENNDECPETTEDYKALSVETEDGEKEKFVLWTYTVNFKESPVLWNKRWDIYFETNDNSVHWFSISNSLMIVLILSFMVAMIITRTVKADIRRYSSSSFDPEDRDSQEETGWKMIHGDVFRPPSHPMLLSICIGSGVQVFAMTVITMIFAVLGFLSPANIGGLAEALIVLFIFMAVCAGYFSTRVFSIFKGRNWKKNTIYTAFTFPGIVFGIFFIVNMFLRGAKSSAAVPFVTFVKIIALWFGISVPLVFAGSYFAKKKPVPEDPVRTNQIPRQVPDQIWYMNPYLSILLGGILPFGAVFIELHFILTSLWDNQFYYIFGFLFIVLLILIVTSAEISIVMCYFQLCAEDYHWWWRSYLTSGSSALYVFIYSISFFRYLSITKFISILLYFSYSFIMSLAFALLTGAIGFYSCYLLVRKIYSSIHIN
ncbi:PHG1A protein [Dictyostelium purpureum]|uniref:Transmembrane 9 superfamily member n=1 Tax=Dictyostelium purpureum TaxID=5786 RepID=F0ZYS5_DICPU|nr:PHG1A protein [Dictyostelium purpureum]EGC30895.1 PHG1A protein [Dictyostelium purpureum]|eukprot:XP_003292568.1 PHG1A protein [Dictyostelium purpureum]